MRPWKHTFRMRDLLIEDGSLENVRRTAKELSRRMKQSGLFADYDGELLIEQFRDDGIDVDDFNEILDAFWDYCDAHRIWVPAEGKVRR